MNVSKYLLFLIVFFSCSNELEVGYEEKYEEAMFQYRNENYDMALESIEFVFSGFENIDSELQIKSLYLRGFVFYLKDDNKLAFKDYLRALEIASSIGDNLRVAKLNNEIGQLFFESELYDQALIHFRNALSMSEYVSAQDKAHFNYGVGKTLNMVGSVESGLDYLIESVDINLFLKNHTALISDYNEIAIAQRRVGNFDQAIEMYMKAESIISLTQNPQFHSWQLYNNLGNAYLEKGNLVKAEELLNKSLDFRTNDAQLWITYNNLGKVFNQKGEYEKAWLCFRKSLDYNKEKGELNELAITNEALKRTFENLNQPDSLLYYTQLINDMAIPLIQSKSWLKDEEEKIALLTKYQEYEKLKAEEEQFAKMSWLVAFIMTFIFMSGLLSVRLWKIYNYKSPQKAHAMIRNLSL